MLRVESGDMGLVLGDGGVELVLGLWLRSGYDFSEDVRVWGHGMAGLLGRGVWELWEGYGWKKGSLHGWIAGLSLGL